MSGNESNYRTQQIWIKKGHRMYPYFQTLYQNAKKMYNVVNFYIRQVYTALTKDKEWQPLQIYWKTKNSKIHEIQSKRD